MDVKECYKLLVKKYPNMKVVSCYEYKDIYVFDLVPSDYNDKNPIMDSSFSVNKLDGIIMTFQPFRMPIDEYLSGKEVKIFK